MNKDIEILNKLLKLFDNYQNKIDDCESKVVTYSTPKELKEKLDLSITTEGSSYNELLNAVGNYLTLSVKTSHKQFFNQLFGGYNLPSIIGEMTAGITNTSMYTFEMSPVATLMELELVEKMCSYIGYKNGDGIFTSGGSQSNLQAMFCARNHHFPDIVEKGVQSSPKMVAFVSEEAHYSFDKAANILGLGTSQLIKVKTDASGRMIPDELERLIEKSIKNKEYPFFIGLTAGTTLKGAFDPIAEISPIAKKHNIWLHADGSWGGAVIFSKKYRNLTSGIEEVDSFTWNPHKLMNVSLSCSALLLKEKGILERDFSNHKIDYLFHENETGAYDLGKKSFQCGRRVDSLKLWLSWKYFGDKGYENRIDELFRLAHYATQLVKEKTEIELMNVPSFLNICFRWIPNFEVDINQFNLELRAALLKSGSSMVNYGFIDKNLVIRLVLINPEIDSEDIDKLFKNLERIAAELTANHSKKMMV
ncbi:MAG: aspartate aminotransferase family protein [Ignavibacteriae bacterium]|nr:aspartate aminotransferase family protein [Ignavibacteriota bacterium]